MLFATTNEERFLTDDTGNRRWLPVEIEQVDRERIAADRAQLWAEGAVAYRANGIAWQAAVTLAEPRLTDYEVSDVWETAIASWLTTPAPPGAPGPQGAPCERPLSVRDVLAGALRMPESAMDRKAELRAARVLRQLGYARSVMWDTAKERAIRRWVRA